MQTYRTRERMGKVAFLISLCVFIFMPALCMGQCSKRFYNDDSFVCVCSDQFCDDIIKVMPPSNQFYVSMTSSRDEFRFEFNLNPILSNQTAALVDAEVFINSSNIMQTMIGFGGAFTDSTGINVATLSATMQDVFVSQYFSPSGLEYNVGRIPIAGSDFSTHPYSYDDVPGDTELLFFNLTQEDYLYKLPLIKKAQQMSARPILLFASPWSPPSWMKENGMFNGSGGLLPEMQQPWANYFVKFLDAYESEGVTLWGLTVQNEPSAGTTDYPWNCCHFTGEEERDFLKGFLGPTLEAAGYRFLKMMVGDDSRFIYPGFVETVLNDTECYAYSDGVAVHWYSDDIVSASVLTEIHDKFPDKFILYTEACAGYIPAIPNHVALGAWSRGEEYASDIMNNINHWSTGWTDWNMALDLIGGPNWASNFVDSPIIINMTANEFYKQPMFYALGHFSKYVTDGSRKLDTTVSILTSDDEAKIGPGKIDATAFLDASGYTIAVIINKLEQEKVVEIKDVSGNSLIRTMPPKSIETIIYME